MKSITSFSVHCINFSFRAFFSALSSDLFFILMDIRSSVVWGGGGAFLDRRVLKLEVLELLFEEIGEVEM